MQHNPVSVDKDAILLVDDEENILEMVGGRLRMEGYQVYTATNAEDALDLLGITHVNLVILDISITWNRGYGFSSPLCRNLSSSSLFCNRLYWPTKAGGIF